MAESSGSRRTVAAIWRIESARLIAALARLVNDVGLAEDLAQDALVAALEQWPVEGVPDNPGAWLMTVAKRRAVDWVRRDQTRERKYAELRQQLETEQVTGPADVTAAAALDVGDDLLRLIFIACHPVLSTEAQVALALRLLGGLTTEEIAHAFLVPTPTIAQRITRAKRTLAAAQVPFATPQENEWAARLASVLEVIYLIFNEGYAASAGDTWTRPLLCEEALRLGRILAGVMPGEPEVHGLVALMEIQASRLRARVGAAGEPVLLLEQDRARWDQLLIQRGLAALARRALGRDLRSVHAASGHCGLSRPRAHGRGHGLAAHRRALRCPGPIDAVPRGRVEPGRGAGHGLRAGGRPGTGRPARPGAVAGRVSSAAQRAR
ncbi:MAG: sigma-70 family RNA polymerase sigma factor [Caldilineaceae bacterium]